MGSVPACWDQFGKIVYKTLYMARVKTSWKLSILYGKYEKKGIQNVWGQPSAVTESVCGNHLIKVINTKSASNVSDKSWSYNTKKSVLCNGFTRMQISQTII